jgi:CheY-like chemotaxis protein
LSKTTASTVLLVDDEETQLHIRRLLLEAAGYRTLVALTPSGALRLFEHEPVDAAVVDYFMPEMSGDELCRSMKRIKPEIPLILLSGIIPEDLSDCPDYVVVKGFSTQELLDKIAEVVAR